VGWLVPNLRPQEPNSKCCSAAQRDAPLRSTAGSYLALSNPPSPPLCLSVSQSLPLIVADRPTLRTNRTSLVSPLVLSGHAA
jgi:hypothetical protein